jgi:tetratricopeptide (TPR) repeat protein
MACLELGDKKEFDAVMERLVKLEPQDARILSNLGVYLREKGDLRGRDYVIRAAQVGPRDPDVLLNLTTLLMDEKAYGEVIKICNRIIRSTPQLWTAYDVRGGAYHEMRDYKRAEKEFRKCVEGDPTDLRHHLNLANALYGLGRLEEAIAEQTLVIEKKPGDAEAHAARALAEAESGRSDDALRDIATATRLAGDNLVVRNYEKNVFETLGLKVPRKGLPRSEASAATPPGGHPRRRRK